MSKTIAVHVYVINLGTFQCRPLQNKFCVASTERDDEDGYFFIAPASGAPYSYGKEKETHELIFSWLSWLAVLLFVGTYARRRRRRRRRRRSRTTWRSYHTPNNRLTETCILGLPCTSLILDIHVMINWHLAGSRSLLIEVIRFFEVDQVLVFDWKRGLMSGQLVENRAGLFGRRLIKTEVTEL